jgi:hypothetical protein
MSRSCCSIRALMGAALLAFAMPAVLDPHVAGATTSCTPVASPAQDTADNHYQDFLTDSGIEHAFDAARAAEGCTTPFVLPTDPAHPTDPTTNFDLMPPQMQMLTLFNLERTDRGLNPLILDSTLLSQINLNHSLEMAQYAYFAHQSPINAPALPTGYFDEGILNRDIINPGIGDFNAPSRSWCYLSENIEMGQVSAAQGAYQYMYADSGSLWGHRHSIIGYFNYGGDTPDGFGVGDFIGIGATTTVPADAPFYNPNITTYVFGSDFLQDRDLTNPALGTGQHEPSCPFPAPTSTYTPPATADTSAPALNPPTYTGGIATATGVQEQAVPDATKQAGVTGVAFYFGSPESGGAFSNTFTTVQATYQGNNTWSAQVASGSGTLHAVAYDGSGNYTDCPATNSGSCGAGGAPPLPSVNLTQGWNALGVPTTAYTDTSTLSSDIQSQNSSGGLTVNAVATFADGRYSIFVPGFSSPVSLAQASGVEVLTSTSGAWMPSGTPASSSIQVPLHTGWNFVSVPFPVTITASHLCSQISATTGLSCNAAAIYTPGGVTAFTPGSGATNFTVNRSIGVMVDVTGMGNWTPS